METLVSSVALTVSSTMGHSVSFQAGVPRRVPSAIVNQAIQAGARPTQEGFPDNTSTDSEALTPETVAAVIRDLIEEGDPDTLTDAGKVRATAINDRIGQRVPSDTREMAYHLIRNGEV